MGSRVRIPTGSPTTPRLSAVCCYPKIRRGSSLGSVDFCWEKSRFGAERASAARRGNRILIARRQLGQYLPNVVLQNLDEKLSVGKIVWICPPQFVQGIGCDKNSLVLGPLKFCF